VIGTSPLAFLGIEIGGTKLQLAMGPGDWTIAALERRVIRPEAGAKGLLDQIAEAHACLVSSSHGRPAAAGIGFGGPVDVDRGVILRSHQIEGWEGFALADWVREVMGIPLVSIQNDADTAGLGEARFGAGRGLSPIFYATIGSGIGGGLIVDGRIYRGSGLGASEIGHLWIDDPASGPGC
jgi:glucokinase